MLIGKKGLSFNDKFYPYDLPKEWALDYYSNIFDCVLLNDITKINIEEITCDFRLILEFNDKNIVSNNKDIIFWTKCSNYNKAQEIVNKTNNISIQSSKLLAINIPFIKIDNEFIYYSKEPVFLTDMPKNNKLIVKKIKNIPNNTCIVFITQNSEKLHQAKTIVQLLGL